MGTISLFKIITLVLLFSTVCYGFDHNYKREFVSENTLISKDVEGTTEVSEVLQHSYSGGSSTPGIVSVVSGIVGLALIGACIYFCCRCRSQRNQGVVVNMNRNNPPPATQIIIQQQQPLTQPPYPATEAIPHSKQHAPPPYDTQPTWGPPPPQFQQPPPPQFQQPPPPQFQQPPPPHHFQQQPPQQYPTSCENPNYGSPPVNTPYGQEKY